MKETTFPTVDGTTVNYEAVEKMYMVDLNGKGYFTIYKTGKGMAVTESRVDRGEERCQQG